MTQTRTRAPWLTAGALAAVAVALAAVLVAFHLPSRHGRVHTPTKGALTSAEQKAMTAAAQEVVDLLTYTRASFDADFQRALDGMTGALRDDQAKDKAATLAAMTKGKFDLKGEVTQTAVERTEGAKVAVLVSATGYKVPAGSPPVPSTFARFEVTMSKIDGRWLASDLQSVGLA